MIHENEIKYGIAPCAEKVRKVWEQSGISKARFERFNGLRQGAIKEALSGKRPIPVKHWHLFYEPSKTRGKIGGIKPQNKLQLASKSDQKNTPIFTPVIGLDSEELGSLIDKLTG